MFSEKLNSRPTRLIQALGNEIEQRQLQIEGNIDRMLAAQLLGIEQLIAQHSSPNDSGDAVISKDIPAQFETIEVQTELSWEDLMDIIGKALDDRFSVLNETVQKSLKNLEHYLSVPLHNLRNNTREHQAFYEEDPTNFQEMLHGIEHLEQIIKSMQIVMTSNHALLSNRLYHHQQQPFSERAHSAHDHTKPISQSVNTPLAITEEHITNGVQREKRRTSSDRRVAKGRIALITRKGGRKRSMNTSFLAFIVGNRRSLCRFSFHRCLIEPYDEEGVEEHKEDLYIPRKLHRLPTK